MSKGKRSRLSLSLTFSFFAFLLFLVTFSIISALSFILIKIGVFQYLSNYGPFAFLAIVLIASTLLGTLLSFALSNKPLESVRKIISATNRLAEGDFSVRLYISRPPEFEELAKSFNRMAEELGKNELLRSDFINNFSHEFKTPIIAIKGFAEMLKRQDLTEEERHEYLDIVINESARLSTLATNILDLTKLENQAILTEQQEFNLGEQVRRTVLLLESKWAEKRINVSANIEDISYFGSKELLSQIWLNLLDNAVKFTPRHGEISVSLTNDNDQIVFALQDSGLGIRQEHLPQIFNKFFQGESTHSLTGNGLGLAIAKRIAELHEGVIECKSILGKGAEFIVTLPHRKVH